MRDLTEWPWTDEGIECMKDAERFALKRDEIAPILHDTHGKYKLGQDAEWKEVLADLTTAAGGTGISKYTLHMLLFLFLLDEAERKYREAGLSMEIYHDTFDDLRCKDAECLAVYGVHGSFVAHWFPRFFKLTCFGLGRLEFEVEKYKCDEYLRPGAPVVNVHIPSKGPLLESDCAASYEKAKEFFRDEVPMAGGRMPFVTDSWLLSPVNRKLGAKSNIVRFASKYEVLKTFSDPANGDGWRVFSVPFPTDDYTSLPEDTALRKLWKEHFLSGGTMDRGYGICFA